MAAAGERDYLGPSPEEVVRTVLTACRESLETGARDLWELAAPRFRRGLEGPDHLQSVLANDLYRPLTSWLIVETQAIGRIGDSARYEVVLGLESGERTAFLFALAIPAGNTERRWLVSGIERQ